MCGRVGFFDDKGFVYTAKRLFDLQNSIGELNPSYNTAPTQPIATLLQTKEYLYTHFGLIPHWAKDKQFHPFNARAETLIDKPTFKMPFLYKRCIIPANGYFEWQSVAGQKRPFWVHPKNGDFFAFAGIYDMWKDPQSGETITGSAIITGKATSNLQAIHERMPIVIPQNAWELWLDPSVHEKEVLQPLLLDQEENISQFYEVSKAVGNVRNNRPELIKVI